MESHEFLDVEKHTCLGTFVTWGFVITRYRNQFLKTLQHKRTLLTAGARLSINPALALQYCRRPVSLHSHPSCFLSSWLPSQAASLSRKGWPLRAPLSTFLRREKSFFSMVATNSWEAVSGGLCHICTLKSVTVPSRGHLGPVLLANEGPFSLRVGRDPSHQTTWDDSGEMGMQSWKKGSGCYTNT